MNRDQVKGTAKDVAGKIRRKVGEATGDVGEQVKGAGEQIAGKIQKGVGNVEQAAEDKSRDSRR
ncbi:MAG: CsbD family protein [Betaproteobacteria bacterium]